jgi:hypothetical protein
LAVLVATSPIEPKKAIAMSDAANNRTVPEIADVLNRLDGLGKSGDQISVADIQKCLGRDAFGPTLLVIGLLALSPVGDIPGAPTILSFMTLWVAGQMAIGRNELSIPHFLATRSIKGSHVRKVVKVVRPSLRFLGYIIWSRISFLTQGPFARAIAATCVMLALMLPPLELVPFGATVPSSFITGFSIAILARDGLLALVLTGLLIGAGYFAFAQFA